MIYTDQKRVVNIFNVFFTNVAGKRLTKIENTTTKYEDYLENPNEHSIFLKEVDFGEVCEIISKFDTTKSGDIYRINPKLHKIGANEVTYNLTKLFNVSIALNQFPDKLKIAKVIPIHTSDSKLIPGNYRPISFLPIMRKIFEKLMYSKSL